MQIVNMHDAKSRLSQLVAAIRSGAEKEVVIAINGTPSARLVPIEPKTQLRWGRLKGKIAVPDNIDATDPDVEQLFSGSGD
jgi:prevent-host-death family protein